MSWLISVLDTATRQWFLQNTSTWGPSINYVVSVGGKVRGVTPKSNRPYLIKKTRGRGYLVKIAIFRRHSLWTTPYKGPLRTRLLLCIYKLCLEYICVDSRYILENNMELVLEIYTRATYYIHISKRYIPSSYIQAHRHGSPRCDMVHIPNINVAHSCFYALKWPYFRGRERVFFANFRPLFF